MPIKIRKPVNLLPELWDKIEEQRIKENRSTYHNMIDTMVKAYLETEIHTGEPNMKINLKTQTEKRAEIRSSFGGIKYDPNKIKI